MNARSPIQRLPHAGFSLVELMVVLVIAALLTVLALPAWQRHIERGWRMQARVELMAAMLALERHMLLVASFESSPGSAMPAGEWPRPVPPPPARTRYWLLAASCAGIDLSRCVEIRATPVHRDDACGILVLRSSGEWLSMPTRDADAMPMPAECSA